MNKQLRINNDGLRIGIAVITISLLFILGMQWAKSVDLEEVRRVNIAERDSNPYVAKFDGCTYLRFPHTKEYIHKANCSNPEHKTEGK